MRYRRVGCLNCCGDCHAVVVVINASRRAMAYGFHDAAMRSASLAAVKLGLQAAAVALLPYSSNVTHQAQSTSYQTIDYRLRDAQPAL